MWFQCRGGTKERLAPLDDDGQPARPNLPYNAFVGLYDQARCGTMRSALEGPSTINCYGCSQFTVLSIPPARPCSYCLSPHHHMSDQAEDDRDPRNCAVVLRNAGIWTSANNVFSLCLLSDCTAPHGSRFTVFQFANPLRRHNMTSFTSFAPSHDTALLIR